MVAGKLLRSLRALRFEPPGYAKQGARRAMFQAALEQCEQFLMAAPEAGYATRPVQLFYALSQAGRAIVAASPHISNQHWRVSGHGMTVNTNFPNAADVTVTAAKTGLYPAVASALGAEPLVSGEAISLGRLWPLLPEVAGFPLVIERPLPALLFFPESGLTDEGFSQAEISWVPPWLKEQHGNDPVRVKRYLDRYPALVDSELMLPQPPGSLKWRLAGHGFTLEVRWRTGETPLRVSKSRTLADLGIMAYRSADDLVVTPSLGTMASGLHPFLALWSTLLALSSLAGYEPASWSKMINIDRSAEANPIEHFLDEAVNSIAQAVRHVLATVDDSLRS